MPRGKKGRPAGSAEPVRWQEHAGSEVAPRCMPEPGAAVETKRAMDGATRGAKEIGGRGVESAHSKARAARR